MTNVSLHSVIRSKIRISILLLAGLLILGASAFAQTPGQIINPAVPATNPLDPDGDGWISASGAAFSIEDGQGESEIQFIPIPQFEVEPDADLQTGSNCGKSDIIDLPNGKECSYILYDDVNGTLDDGDDLLLMRIRCADEHSSGSFGYSVLLDTNGLFGFGTDPGDDPNAVDGNPGFEIEIRVKTGGGPGIYVEDCDGTTSGTAIISYDIDSNYQQSYALINDADCSGDAVFHDFFVNVQDIGINSKTKLRPLSATSSSGNSVLGGSASDIGGFGGFNPDQDSIMDSVINYIPPTSGEDLGESGTFPIELGEFTGRHANGSNIITWVTVTEENNAVFELQHSWDNYSFTTINEVQGAGNSTTPSNYRSIDSNPFPYATYYRLKQIDFDGSYTYSHTIEVMTESVSQKELLTVYPNPSTGIFHIDVDANENAPTSVKIHNTNLKLIREIEIPANNGLISQEIDVTSFAKGVYVIQAEQRTRRQISRVVVQ